MLWLLKVHAIKRWLGKLMWEKNPGRPLSAKITAPSRCLLLLRALVVWHGKAAAFCPALGAVWWLDWRFGDCQRQGLLPCAMPAAWPWGMASSLCLCLRVPSCTVHVQRAPSLQSDTRFLVPRTKLVKLCFQNSKWQSSAVPPPAPRIYLAEAQPSVTTCSPGPGNKRLEMGRNSSTGFASWAITARYS